MATPTDTAIPAYPGTSGVAASARIPIFNDGDPQQRMINLTDLRAEMGQAVPGISFISQQVLVADMTDATATTGTIVMTDSLPAGAIVLGSKVIVDGGFAGDTSATLQVGDGSDVDRYSTGTPSVFADAATGIQPGVPSGTKFVVTANTPTLTITSAANFTDVITDDGGDLTITIYFIRTVAV